MFLMKPKKIFFDSMKSAYNHLIPLTFLAAVAVSCNDAFLDCTPKDEVTDANFWQTEEHVQSVANTFTASLKGKDWLNMTETMADSAPWASTMVYRTIGAGNYSTDVKQINDIWKNAYKNIGKTNYFLENYNRATNVSVSVRERYAAEAFFYRAFNYWLLTTYFGDVPYITRELDVNSPDVYRKRDTRQEVISAITKDLEDNYRNLPEYIPAASAEFGRISQCTALALLSRIYLYNGMYEECVNACERAMANSYYDLYDTDKPESDYMDLFTYTGRASRNPANREVLLAYIYNYSLGESARTSHNLSRECWVPNDYARFVPTNSMIETYLTADGKIWDPSTVNSYEEIFQNRDPRMCQSIRPPGASWNGEAGGVASTFTYPIMVNDKKACMTYSGYYMRKYVEPSTVRYVGHDDNDIIMFRYAEVLLNYAEAKEALGTLTQIDLDNSINRLRKRVGMVDLRLDNIPAGSDIRTEIRRERRVELFFEGHRFFDIIRWRQGELLAQDLLGVNKRWLDPSKMDIDISKLSWKTKDGEQYLLIETGRQFNSDKHYLFPVPFEQMQLNPNLAPQNPGWN